MGKYVGEAAVAVGVVLLIAGLLSVAGYTEKSAVVIEEVPQTSEENDIIQEWEAQGNLSNLVRIHHLTFEGREYLVAEGRHGLAICPVQGGMVRIK